MDGRADAFVLFGATGDLVRKKLIPALYELARPGGWACRSSAWPAPTGTTSGSAPTRARAVAEQGPGRRRTTFTELAASLTMVVG